MPCSTCYTYFHMGQSYSHHVRLFVCLSILKVIIVKYGKWSEFCLFSYRGGIYGSKDFKYRRTSKLHFWSKSYNDFKDVFRPWLIRAVGQLWIMGESPGEGLWLLALVTGERWHVTCETRHVTCQIWHVTHDTWFKKK